MQNEQARSNIYALLSRVLLQELDDDMLDTVKNDEAILEFLPNFAKWDLLDTLENGDLLQRHLNPDFINLSVLHLIPYESFYRRDDQMVETGGANPVTDIYSAYNFLVDYEAARVISSDHIGVELEFMHRLVEAQMQAAAENDDAAVAQLLATQKEFLNKHLLQWAILYLLNVKYEAMTPLYHDIADMCIEFLLGDNEYLHNICEA